MDAESARPDCLLDHSAFELLRCKLESAGIPPTLPGCRQTVSAEADGPIVLCSPVAQPWGRDRRYTPTSLVVACSSIANRASSCWHINFSALVAFSCGTAAVLCGRLDCSPTPHVPAAGPLQDRDRDNSRANMLPHLGRPFLAEPKACPSFNNSDGRAVLQRAVFRPAATATLSRPSNFFDLQDFLLPELLRADRAPNNNCSLSVCQLWPMLTHLHVLFTWRFVIVRVTRLVEMERSHLQRM